MAALLHPRSSEATQVYYFVSKSQLLFLQSHREVTDDATLTATTKQTQPCLKFQSQAWSMTYARSCHTDGLTHFTIVHPHTQQQLIAKNSHLATYVQHSYSRASRGCKNAAGPRLQHSHMNLKHPLMCIVSQFVL